jgi:hypothetical protein
VIDTCESTFAELGSVVFPGYMAQIRTALKKPHNLADLCVSGDGVKTILKRLGKNSDFSGCYVLIRDGEPFYVGISRGVVGRLRQHGRGKTEFEATLAYRMACEKSRHKMTRSEAMKDSKFRKKFQEAQGLLNGSKVAFIEIENSLELDLFEAYCAIELNTSKWNTFRTQLELLRFRNECQASKTA